MNEQEILDIINFKWKLSGVNYPRCTNCVNINCSSPYTNNNVKIQVYAMIIYHCI